MALSLCAQICSSVDSNCFAFPQVTAARPLSLSTCISSSSRPLGCHPVICATWLKGKENVLVGRATTEQTVDGQSETMYQDEDECELVSRLELTLGDDDDKIDAYLVKAMKNNNGAAVLLLTDIYGFNDNDARDFAYRLSCFGYNVLVPDLFQGNPFKKETPMSEVMDWLALHTAENVVKAIKTSADWLTEEMAEAGVTKKLGLLGFCFGGGYIFEVLAKDREQQYATAVTVYPTVINELFAAKISVPMLLITGEKDEFSTPETLHGLSSQIKGSEVRVYAGRGHGFAHRPAAEDDEDAENAFLAMKAWFHDKLVMQSPISEKK